MEKDDLRKRLQQYAFRNNNGQIMRTVNILKPQESTVRNICYLMPGEPKESVQDSLKYLMEAGYIRITGPKGETFTGQIEEDNDFFRISLTASGMELLMGVQENPAVEV